MKHTSNMRLPMAVAVALLASGCASAPPAKAPAAPQIPLEQKMSWMLQLEDRRILRVEAPPVPVAPAPPPRGRNRAAAPPPPPAPSADLTVLLSDSEARVRRRAALAIGRVGLAAGVQPLVAKLSDADPDVREMAAFALGLIGDGSAVTALTTALTDASPIVRGRGRCAPASRRPVATCSSGERGEPLRVPLPRAVTLSTRPPSRTV